MVRSGVFAIAVVLGLLLTSTWVSPVSSAFHVAGVTRVSQGAASLENNPSVAFGADGQVYVAYSRFSAGPTNDIILRADQDGWAADGRPVFTSFRVANDVAGQAGWGFFDTVPMVVDASGSIYMAWVDSRDSATTGTDIRIARSDNDGSSFGASVRISDFTGLNNENYPRLAVGPTGTIYAVFVDDRDGQNDVFFSYSMDQGVTWSPNAKLNDVSGGNSQTYPRIAVDSADRVFITWTDFTSPLRVLMDRSLDGGATWGTDMVIGNSSGSSWIADVAVGRNDIVHVAWQDDRLGDAGIYYARSVDHGASFLLDGRVNFYPMGGDPLPRIATTEDGVVYIVWAASGPPGELAYTVYGDDGAVFYGWGGVTGGAQRYGVGVDRDGNLFVVWSQNDGAPSLEVYTLYVDVAPLAVTGLAVTPGASPGTAVASWNANTELDISGYEVWRTGPSGPSTMVAFVTGTSYSDAGLSDGRWYYTVVPVDRNGHVGPARSAYIDIGLTTDDRLDQLEAQVNDLQTRLGDLQTDVTDLQNQNNNLQTDLDDANGSLDRLGDQLASSQQLNMILLVVLLVLVILSMLLGMRRRKSEPAPAYAPPMQTPPPPQ